jgi:hypothetical protein
MNKKTFALSSLAAASILFVALASCGTVVNSSSNPTGSSSTPTSSSSQPGTSSTPSSASTDDKKVAAIRVKTGTLASSFQLNYKVIDATIFEDLVIETLNAGGTKLGEVAYADAPSAFSHSDIATGALSGSSSYLLTYKSTDGTFQVSVSYKVIYAVPNSWAPNKTYTAFTSSLKAVSSAKNIQSGEKYPFMEATSFYVGTQNATSLFPVVTPDDEAVTYIDTLDPSKVGVSLTDDKGTALTLSDYMLEADVALLKSKGQVKFIEGKTGSFKLTLSYAGGAISTLPNIVYDIKVVDGYNINEAKDLFVLNNDDVDGDEAGGEGPKANDALIRKWKEDKGIPFDRNYHVGIFQKDIVLGKDDIPTNYIWDSTRDGSLAALDGSLKDFSYLVKHTFLTTNSADELNFAVYGNYHKLSLGTDFPYVIREGLDAAGGITGKMVEGHATIFGSTSQWVGDDVPLVHKASVKIQDLQGIGNEGVSTDSDGLNTGVLFFKPWVDSTVENCVLTNYYNTIVYANPYPEKEIQPVGNIIASRLNNTFNAGIFNWNSNKIEISNSEIMNAGGPLIFNQSSRAFDYTKLGITSDISTKSVTATIDVDSSSYLENWVAGQGGWFKQYSAESEVTSLKQVNLLLMPATGLKSSFLDNMSVDPSTFAQGKINLLVLTMLNGSGIGAATGACLAKVNINSTPVVDYDGGRIDTLTKLGGGDPSGLYSTPFGALSFLDTMYSSSAQAMLFGNCNTSSKYHYATVNSNMKLVSMDSFVMEQMGASASADLDASFQTMDQMTISMLGGHQGTDFTNKSNPYASYVGSNSFTLLLGIKHAA